ncbi:MAG: hypothetical protein BMS9Abin28_2458 [Anaerolineae bacterium]|nr:MAG: hypothetical protein BMS9Abin28_2458 [Anaerolineae bacterium]
MPMDLSPIWATIRQAMPVAPRDAPEAKGRFSWCIFMNLNIEEVRVGA